jgi:hypothetical protein
MRHESRTAPPFTAVEWPKTLPEAATMPNVSALFENQPIRRIYDEATETWWFSVVDIVKVLIQQPDTQVAANYWRVLKSRLKKEGSQAITNCNGLKMTAEDGRQRLTDCAQPGTRCNPARSLPY